MVLWQIWVQPKVAMAQWIAALASFVHLALWSHLRLTNETLIAALVSCLIFGLMHTGFALLAMRHRPETMQAQKHGIWLGPVAVLLVTAPMFALPEVPWMIWPTVLLLNLMTIAVAALTLSLAPVLLALCVTLLAMGLWLFRLDVSGSPWGILLTLGGFALVFAAAGAVLSSRLRLRTGSEKRSGSEWLTSLEGLLPMCSAALPFILLIIATHRLNLVNPTPVFTLGVLLSLGLLVLMRLSKLPALGLRGADLHVAAGVCVVESALRCGAAMDGAGLVHRHRVFVCQLSLCLEVSLPRGGTAMDRLCQFLAGAWTADLLGLHFHAVARWKDGTRACLARAPGAGVTLCRAEDAEAGGCGGAGTRSSRGSVVWRCVSSRSSSRFSLIISGSRSAGRWKALRCAGSSRACRMRDCGAWGSAFSRHPSLDWR